MDAETGSTSKSIEEAAGDREHRDEMNASIGGGSTPIRPPSQPCTNTSTMTPNEALIESSFIAAAWIGITIERNTGQQNQRREREDDADDSGSLPASTGIVAKAASEAWTASRTGAR